MSVVLHGLGMETIDTGSSVVAFGLAIDLTGDQTVAEAAASTGIENLFVIDFDGRRRASKGEYRRFKRLVRMMQTGQLHFKERKRKGARGSDIEYWADRRPITRKVA